MLINNTMPALFERLRQKLAQERRGECGHPRGAFDPLTDTDDCAIAQTDRALDALARAIETQPTQEEANGL